MSFLKNLFGQNNRPANTPSNKLPDSEDLLGNLSMEASEKLKQSAEEAKSQVPSTVSSYDPLGRRIDIPREKWGEEVLPKLLEEHKNHADRLFEVISRALDFAFHDKILEAAEHLNSIDGNRERGTCALNMVLALNGQAAKAINQLETFIETSPFSHNAMVTLARIYFQAGENSKAEELVDKAVSLEPNQPEPLAWHYSAVLKSEGEEAARAEMQRLAEIPDSYRPALILGKICLDAKENDEALKWFRQALDYAPDNPDVMTALSGELGKAALHKKVFDLCLPIYKYEKHGPVPGCNIIQSLIAVGHIKEAEDMLHMLCRVSPDNVRRILMQLSAQINELRRQAYIEHLKENPPEKKERQVEFMRLRRPLWFYPLNEPEWLFPERSKDALRLHFTSFSVDLPEDASPQQKDNLAGLSFSVPVFFSEILANNPAIAPAAYLPVMEDSGPVINTQPWPQTHLQKIAGLDEFSPDYLIDGILGGNEKDAIVTLRLHDKEGKTLNEVRRSGKWENLPTVLCEAGNEILLLASENKSRIFQTIPHPALTTNYLQMTSHLLGQFMAMRQIIPPQMLSGRREILESLYAFAVNSGPADIPKVMFMAGLEYEKCLAGRCHLEYEHRAMNLSNLAQPGTVFHRCVPHFLKVFDRQDECQQLIKQVTDDAPEDYREWLNKGL